MDLYGQPQHSTTPVCTSYEKRAQNAGLSVVSLFDVPTSVNRAPRPAVSTHEGSSVRARLTANLSPLPPPPPIPARDSDGHLHGAQMHSAYEVPYKQLCAQHPGGLFIRLTFSLIRYCGKVSTQKTTTDTMITTSENSSRTYSHRKGADRVVVDERPRIVQVHRIKK